MLGETYQIERSRDGLRYAFLSDGPQGTILKFVLFTRIHDNVFNLGFGDFVEGAIKDSVVSNNEDLVKIMNTVASTIYSFLAAHPKSKVYVEPVDEKRSSLYHHIFRRKFDEILPFFTIKGLTSGGWVDYEPGNRYLAFELERKSNFEQPNQLK